MSLSDFKAPPLKKGKKWLKIVLLTICALIVIAAIYFVGKEEQWDWLAWPRKDTTVVTSTTVSPIIPKLTAEGQKYIGKSVGNVQKALQVANQKIKALQSKVFADSANNAMLRHQIAAVKKNGCKVVRVSGTHHQKVHKHHKHHKHHKRLQQHKKHHACRCHLRRKRVYYP